MKRITPACAGKTLIKVMKEGAVKDHPRVCGENYVTDMYSMLRRGSPPRVRGKLVLQRKKQLVTRITPACAGKTYCEYVRDSFVEDHPRVCGENRFSQRRIIAIRGSPPRVRGKLRLSCTGVAGIRITPACAGKTAMRFRNMFARVDHPRVCGENCKYGCAGMGE